MTSATSFLETVTFVQDDIETISSISDGFGDALDITKDVLEVPGELEDMLREPATAIDFPDPLVTVLGLIPFGVGTAIKTIDRVAGTAADVIEEQADIMGALDDATQTPRDIIDVVNPVNSALGTATTVAGTVNGLLQREATRLGESLGDQEVQVTSELGARMEEYQESAQEWFDTRDGLLAPFRAAENLFEAAVAELESLVPGTQVIEDAFEVVLDVIKPITDAARSLESAICIDFTITPEVVIPGIPAITITPAIPPVYGTNPFTGDRFIIIPGIPAIVTPAVPEIRIPAVRVDICEILKTAQSGFDAIIETVVNAALSLVGVDFGEIAGNLLDDLLGPLDPIFDAIAALKSAADAIIADITAKLDPLVDNITDLMDGLYDAANVASLFDNTIRGDLATGPEDMADVLVGTDGEDAMFGLLGDDVLTGGGGDFLFGGEGKDVLNSNGDEVYGGRGRDTLNGSNEADFLDGGGGRDKMIGRNGQDILYGGGDKDQMSGGNGADRMDGGDGGDEMSGGKGRDEMIGGRGADVMKGGKGQDDMSGGRGKDVMGGGQGHDRLTGDEGSDIFVFRNNSGNDVVTDFDANDNAEKIDLSAVAEIVDRADLFDNHMVQLGEDVFIDDGAGTTITLQDVTLSDLNTADFIF